MALAKRYRAGKTDSRTGTGRKASLENDYFRPYSGPPPPVCMLLQRKKGKFHSYRPFFPHCMAFLEKGGRTGTGIRFSFPPRGEVSEVLVFLGRICSKLLQIVKTAAVAKYYGSRPCSIFSIQKGPPPGWSGKDKKTPDPAGKREFKK